MSVTVDFFLDFNVIQSYRGVYIDMAKGHLILYGHHDKDRSLTVAALVDGSSVDFLFGVNNASQNSVSRTKSSNVKTFIRQLESKHQLEVANFYSTVYQAIVGYHHWRSNTYFWCCDTRKSIMKSTIEEAFQRLKERLGNHMIF